MVLLKIKKSRQYKSNKKALKRFITKSKEARYKKPEKELDILYNQKQRWKQRWVVGFLSLIFTFLLGAGTHFLAVENDNLTASVTKIICDPSIFTCDEREEDNPEEHVIFDELIPNWIEWIILFSAGAAILVIMIGGGMFLVGVGNEEMYTKAKTTTLWAVAGLLIAMFSYAIVQIINNIAYPGT